MTSYNIAAVRFRAYQADEDEHTSDTGTPIGGGGGGGGGPFTVTPEAFFPIPDGSGGYTWLADVGGGSGGVITPDTWQHAVFTYLMHADGSRDHSLTLDGSLAWSITNGDPGGDPTLPTAVLFGVLFGVGGITNVVYLDEIKFQGTLIDDFEGGTLAAWDAVVDAAAISTDQAHNGTHSLKCDADPATNQGYVQHNFAAAYEVTYTCDLWIYLPTATLVADAEPLVVSFVG